MKTLPSLPPDVCGWRILVNEFLDKKKPKSTQSCSRLMIKVDHSKLLPKSTDYIYAIKKCFISDYSYYLKLPTYHSFYITFYCQNVWAILQVTVNNITVLGTYFYKKCNACFEGLCLGKEERINRIIQYSITHNKICFYNKYFPFHVSFFCRISYGKTYTLNYIFHQDSLS